MEFRHVFEITRVMHLLSRISKQKFIVKLMLLQLFFNKHKLSTVKFVIHDQIVTIGDGGRTALPPSPMLALPLTKRSSSS